MMRNDGQPNEAVPNGRKTEITVDDLIVYKGLTKPLSEYNANDKTFNVTVARWMEKEGHHLSSGDIIPYIVINEKAKDPNQRARHPETIFNVCEVDITWYLTKQISAPVQRLCSVFGSPSPEIIDQSLEIKTKYNKIVPNLSKSTNHSQST